MGEIPFALGRDGDACVRLGTPALTSRGLGAEDFELVGYLPDISPTSPLYLPYAEDFEQVAAMLHEAP